MRVLIIGGTGLISVGIVKHLLGRGAEVVCFNRGQTPAKDTKPLPGEVRQVHGDRHDVSAMLAAFDGERFDATIDMVSFSNDATRGGIDLARHVRSGHHLFCSTVCTYGVKVPPGVVVDETFPQEPISDYGRAKLASERLLLDQDDVPVTVVRPSHTYGEGSPLIDQLEFDATTWRRMLDGKPALVADSGMALWNSTHRDDVGALFAHAAGREVCFGKAYNATTERVFTWADYYREAAAALDIEPTLVTLPADAIVAADPERFGLLREISRYHGPYTSRLAREDVPEFDPQVTFADGAKRTLDHLRATDTLKPSDDVYDRLAASATQLN